jgi:transcriptional regulator with XRE-family HTH domain
MNIGNAIKIVRKQKSLSQTALAEMTGLTQKALSEIERGGVSPHTKSLEKICQALDIPMPLLYFIAIEEQDIPEDRRFLYEQLYGPFRNLAFELFGPRYREYIKD